MITTSNSRYSAPHRYPAVAHVLSILLYTSILFGCSEDICKASARERTSGPKTIRTVVLRDYPPTYFEDDKTGHATGIAVNVPNKVVERGGANVIPGVQVSLGNALLPGQLTGALEGFAAPPEYVEIDLNCPEQLKSRWTALGIVLTVTALACLSVLATAAWRYRSLRLLNRTLVETLHERERIESALRESESRFKTLAEASFEGIALTERGKFLDVNDQLAGMVGWKREELIGTMVSEIIAPEYRDVVKKAQMANLLEPYESAIIRKDGAIVQVETRARTMEIGGRQVRLTAIRDITERKQTEEALRANEGRLRSAMEATEQGWFDLNLRTGEVVVSPEYVRIIGYDPAEFKTSLQEWMDAIHPEDRNGVIKAYRECLEANETTTLEYRRQTKTGDWKWFRSTAKIVGYDAENKPLRISGTHADITPIKRTEAALRESLDLYRTLVDASPDAIFMIDPHGLITFRSPRALQMFGYSPGEDLTGRSVLDWVSPEDRERAMNNIGYLLAEGAHNGREYTLVKKDGARFRGEVNAAPLYAPDGSARGILLVTRDITARKRAEEELSEKNRQLNETVLELEQARNMLHLIIESIPVRVFWKDRDSCYLGCNSLFAHDAGLSDPQQLLGRDDFAMKWRDQAELYRADDFLVMESGIPKMNIVEPQTTPTGSTKWLNTSKVPLRLPDGEVFGVLGAYEDITERMQAEEERRRLEDRLQRAEKMEALGTMAGGVAHDLNNVLGIVVGFSELLLRDVDASSAVRSRAREILQAGERAAAIVQDLLTLTRRGVPSKVVLNLNDIVTDCFKSPEFAKIVSYHPKVETRVELEADLLNISGSFVHVSKSLMNLVTNAAEAMPNGGTLTIMTRNQYLDKPVSGYDEVKEGDYIVLSVSDTGEGIPGADLKRIFEPFYTKKVMGRSGTGLGLAVVWGTVKDHEGYINVESEEGKGSAFTLYFPITREEICPEEVSQSVTEYMAKGESLLVVDDVKEQRDLATAMLTTLNYAVTSVSSGEDALEYIRSHPVDLVVLDMIMDPGMDGLDTYSKILELYPHQRAIIVSGFAETERVSKAQKLGAGAYVKKPYVLKKLGSAVRYELDRGDLTCAPQNAK